MDLKRETRLIDVLMGCSTVKQMAAVEGFTNADGYALGLAEAILDNGAPLDRQRERLQALAQVSAGLAGSQPIAEELARHQVILSALFQRLAKTAGELAIANKNAAAVERYTTAAVRVNKASLSTLSALVVVKGQQAPTTSGSGTTASSELDTAPASPTLLEDVSLSGESVEDLNG